MNSIKFSFGSESDPEGEQYLWIEPPWRLMAGGRFVMGSQDCPDHEDYEVERGHPLMAPWYLRHHGRDEATGLVRDGIRRYNERQDNRPSIMRGHPGLGRRGRTVPVPERP